MRIFDGAGFPCIQTIQAVLKLYADAHILMVQRELTQKRIFFFFFLFLVFTNTLNFRQAQGIVETASFRQRCRSVHGTLPAEWARLL